MAGRPASSGRNWSQSWRPISHLSRRGRTDGVARPLLKRARHGIMRRGTHTPTRRMTMTRASAHEASEVTEEYCVTIYNMTMEGEPVIGARLAERFHVAAPTVTETLKRLVRDGLVEM